MKGALILLVMGGLAGVQTPEAAPAERYTLAEIARAFGSCRQYIETAQENQERFPMPRLEGVPYSQAQSGADWLEACVLLNLQDKTVELRPLG